jgi:hypothetical protein
LVEAANEASALAFKVVSVKSIPKVLHRRAPKVISLTTDLRTVYILNLRFTDPKPFVAITAAPMPC